MSHSPNPTTSDPRASIRAAMDAAFRQAGFTAPRFHIPEGEESLLDSHLTTRQSAPNPATAPQTTPSHQNVQNEPNSPDRQRLASTLHRPALAPTRQSAPNPANAPQPSQICKTNPTPARPPRPLTPNHLRAARLLVAGHTTTDIAAALQIDRHTLADWKRLPAFQQEIRRLIDRPPVAT